MEKSHLKIRYHKRGLSLKKDCVMNMTVLRHEYKGGCNSDIRFCWEWRWGWGVTLVG